MLERCSYNCLAGLEVRSTMCKYGCNNSLVLTRLSVEVALEAVTDELIVNCD
jgi:hypothetical protein